MRHTAGAEMAGRDVPPHVRALAPDAFWALIDNYTAGALSPAACRLGQEAYERASRYCALSPVACRLVDELFSRVSSDASDVREDVRRVREIFAMRLQGVDASIKSLDYGEPLLALALGHSLAMTRALLECGGDVNAVTDMDGETLGAHVSGWPDSDAKRRMLALLLEFATARQTALQLRPKWVSEQMALVMLDNEAAPSKPTSPAGASHSVAASAAAATAGCAGRGGHGRRAQHEAVGMDEERSNGCESEDDSGSKERDADMREGGGGGACAAPSAGFWPSAGQAYAQGYGCAANGASGCGNAGGMAGALAAAQWGGSARPFDAAAYYWPRDGLSTVGIEEHGLGGHAHYEGAHALAGGQPAGAPHGHLAAHHMGGPMAHQIGMLGSMQSPPLLQQPLLPQALSGAYGSPMGFGFPPQQVPFPYYWPRDGCTVAGMEDEAESFHLPTSEAPSVPTPPISAQQTLATPPAHQHPAGAHTQSRAGAQSPRSHLPLPPIIPLSLSAPAVANGWSGRQGSATAPPPLSHRAAVSLSVHAGADKRPPAVPPHSGHISQQAQWPFPAVERSPIVDDDFSSC